MILSVLRRVLLFAGWAEDIFRLHIQDGSLTWLRVHAGCWPGAQLGCRLQPIQITWTSQIQVAWWLDYNRECPTSKHFKQPKQKLQSYHTTSALLPPVLLVKALIRITQTQSGRKTDSIFHWRRDKNLL